MQKMVAFNTASLPSNITTVEQLAVWALMVLNNLHPQATVMEVPGVVERVATAQPFEVTATEPYKWRFMGRVSIELANSWQSTGKMWQHAQSLSSASIPNDFKS